jgi:hypothetical protein
MLAQLEETTSYFLGVMSGEIAADDDDEVITTVGHRPVTAASEY